MGVEGGAEQDVALVLLDVEGDHVAVNVEVDGGVVGQVGDAAAAGASGLLPQRDPLALERRGEVEQELGRGGREEEQAGCGERAEARHCCGVVCFCGVCLFQDLVLENGTGRNGESKAGPTAVCVGSEAKWSYVY